MKAVGYVRISTEEQATKGVSLDAQKSAVRRWAEDNAAELLYLFEDVGVSGMKLKQRKALQGALEAVCEHKAALVVFSLSRLSRSTKDTLYIAERLDKAGADLVSLSERIDTTSASGKMLFRLMAVLNEFERDQISERTSSVLQYKKARGEAYSPTPYGFDRIGKMFVENEREQLILMRILDLRKLGTSLKKIADTLNARGILAKRGGKWFPSTVKSVLETAGEK